MASPLALVRTTTDWVVQQSRHVVIHDGSIQREADKLLSLPPLKAKWGDYPAHYYKEGSDLMAQYCLVLDTLNFCFWPNKGLEYDNLAGPLRDVLLKDEHAFDGERLANISKEELVKWLGADFPLVDERLRLLREVGEELTRHFDGKASVLIQKANGSAAKLVSLMTAHFPGFRDHCVYKGRQVFLYKRVQIFVGDVWGAYEGKGLGKFDDIGELTMFPDYSMYILTHSHSLFSLSHSHSHLILILILSVSSFSQSPHSLILILSFSFSHSHSLVLILSFSFSHSHSLFLILFFSLSLSHSILYPFFSSLLSYTILPNRSTTTTRAQQNIVVLVGARKHSHNAHRDCAGQRTRGRNPRRERPSHREASQTPRSRRARGPFHRIGLDDVE
jgi:Potential Queuosine, Q, salvage protein family